MEHASEHLDEPTGNGTRKRIRKHTGEAPFNARGRAREIERKCRGNSWKDAVSWVLAKTCPNPAEFML